MSGRTMQWHRMQWWRSMRWHKSFRLMAVICYWFPVTCAGSLLCGQSPGHTRWFTDQWHVVCDREDSSRDVVCLTPSYRVLVESAKKILTYNGINIKCVKRWEILIAWPHCNHFASSLRHFIRRQWPWRATSPVLPTFHQDVAYNPVPPNVPSVFRSIRYRPRRYMT